MSYIKHEFETGDTLYASDLNEMDEQIYTLSEDIADLKQNGTGTGNGLTTAQRNSLLAVVNAIGTFNVANGQELIDNFNSAWKITINATGVTLDKTTLTFVESVNQTLVATVEPSDSTDEVMWASSNESIAKVTNGIVTPISNGSCTITATAGSVSASCEVTVNVESVIVTYTVVNNLTNVSTDNPVGTITENSGYTAILTPDTDYEFDSVVVTMGGVDVTSDVYSNGVIVITSVTGNIVITASAVQASGGEVTLLKSITGDGASWIDTGFILTDSTYTMELSAKLHGGETIDTCALLGADGYSVGTPYGKTLVYPNSEININGYLNNASFSSIGSWNKTDNNLLTNKQFWIEISNGSQKVYLDKEHTTQQTHLTNGTATYNTSLEFVPIPMYLFKCNTTANAHETYTPSSATIYSFKITDADGNAVLNLVPAKQGSKIGMYDTVAETFHENIGTGTFTHEELEAV